MSMKLISKTDFSGKTILLRADLNSGFDKGKILMSERIKQSSKTIKFLKKGGAKVVVIAHQSRPGKKDFTSLEQHAKLLNKFVKIKFIPDIIGKKAQSAIKNLKDGEAILLDNIRGLKEEFEEGKTDYIEKLSSWCDIYVNDAFSVCHRKQASITSFPRYFGLRKSYAGPILEEEVDALKKINLGKCLYILAGAKPADNILLLNKHKVLSGGLFGQMCLQAKGQDFGAQSKYLRESISDYEDSIKNLKKKEKSMGKLLEMPIDFGVKANGKRKDLDLEQFPSKYEIFDIGPKTQKKYIEEIKKAKVIYMKGPVGYYMNEKFLDGTKAILKAISKSKGFSLLGGGDLNDAIDKSGISKKKFNHISLSGGALLHFVAGEKLPGLKALGFYGK